MLSRLRLKNHAHNSIPEEAGIIAPGYTISDLQYNPWIPGTGEFRPRPSIRDQLRKIRKNISGSVSSGSSSSGPANSPSSYSTTQLLATTSIATAAGSPTAASSVAISPGRTSFSTLSSVSHGPSSSSLALSRNGSHARSSMIISDDELIEDGLIDEDELSQAGENYEADEYPNEELITKNHPEHLKVPSLRIRPSFTSIQTIESAVSGCGYWDSAPLDHSPITDHGDYDTEFLSEPPALKLNAENTVSMPIPQDDIPPTGKHADPLGILVNGGRGGVELLDKVLGYFDDPSDIITLRKVCKSWDIILQRSEVYHSFIRNNFLHIRPGPGEIQSARTYQDFIRVRNQSKSIEAGKIFLVAQIPIPKDSTTIQYHAGRACFFHPWKEPNVIVYDFSQGKKPAKYKYKCSEGSVIVSAALGGGNRSGTLLVYCEFISPSRLRAVCYPLRAGNKLWTNHFTASSQLSYTDQILMKTNGTVTVIAVQNKLLVWKHEGKCLAERELVNQLKGSTNGLLCLSETKIYHITWTGEEKLCVDIYILRDLTYICGHQLKVPNPVRHVFGTFTNNKLYFTIASSLLSGVCSAWRLYCVDDNCPALIDQIEDFPTLDRVLHSRVVFYPHQGSTYVVGQTDFSKQPPTSFLEVYRRGASKGKMLKKQNGYLPRLELEGDSSTWNPLQGDNEYLTWQTTGKLKVFKFVTDQEEEED